MSNWLGKKNKISNGDLIIIVIIFFAIGLISAYSEFYTENANAINIFQATQKDKLNSCVTELKEITTSYKTAEFAIEVLNDELNITGMLIDRNISLESKQKYLNKLSSLEKTLSDIEERYK